MHPRVAWGPRGTQVAVGAVGDVGDRCRSGAGHPVEAGHEQSPTVTRVGTAGVGRLQAAAEAARQHPEGQHPELEAVGLAVRHLGYGDLVGAQYSGEVGGGPLGHRYRHLGVVAAVAGGDGEHGSGAVVENRLGAGDLRGHPAQRGPVHLSELGRVLQRQALGLGKLRDPGQAGEVGGGLLRPRLLVETGHVDRQRGGADEEQQDGGHPDGAGALVTQQQAPHVSSPRSGPPPRR